MRRVVALVTLMLAGCGNGGGPSAPDMAFDCPSDLPSACAPTAATWDGGVMQLMSVKCVPCHNPSGAAKSWPLDSQPNVLKLKQEVLDQVYSCFMPPLDAGQLDESQRQALLGWLVCGAQNN